MKFVLSCLLATFLAAFGVACNEAEYLPTVEIKPAGPSLPSTANPDPFVQELRKSRPRPAPSTTPIPTPLPTITTPPTPTANKALIFNGTGTSQSDTDSLKNILSSHGLAYRVVSSAELELMGIDELEQYRLIVWPGGDSNVMTKYLSGSTRNKIREAVVTRGVHYIGFCAGAWMAVGPAPKLGASPYWGLSIVNGDYLKQYFPNGQSPIATMVWTRFANGDARDLVWWGGPYLPSDAGTVAAKYPDGSSAIYQGSAGNGFVILSGPHPEAPQDWRDATNLIDADGLDYDLAWNLIESALLGTRLSVF